MKMLPFLFFLVFLSFGACENGPSSPDQNIESGTDSTVVQPESDASYFQFQFSESSANCETADSMRCARVDISIPMLKGEAPVSKIINGTLKKLAYQLVGDYLSDEPEALRANNDIGKVAQAFVADYDALMAEEPIEFVTPWSLEITSDVLYETERLFTVEMSYYSYTGGAHPNHAVGLYTFDLESGQTIMTNQLITDLEAFLEIAEEAFRSENDIEPNVPLNEMGYFFEDDFSLPANMAFIEEGVLLTYNPYEVAPYALGYTTFILPYGEIEEVIDLTLTR